MFPPAWAGVEERLRHLSDAEMAVKDKHLYNKPFAIYVFLGNEILSIYLTFWNNLSVVTKMVELSEVCDVCGKDFQNRSSFSSHLNPRKTGVCEYLESGELFC